MADDNTVRLAMSRADTNPGPAPKVDGAQNGGAVIRRVHVKHEVAGYVESVFQARTNDDGTIVHVSREILVEDLTNMVENILRKALSVRAPSQATTYNIPPGTQQP